MIRHPPRSTLFPYTSLFRSSPTTGNTLTQPVGTTNASGVATGTLSSTTAETKTVSATINSVAVTQTATVSVTAGPAAQVAFTVQPSSTTAGTIITPAVRVTVQDAFADRVTSFPGGRPTVTVAIGNNPGGGTLSGTTSRLTGTGGNAGIATFNDLSIDKAGEGYTLTSATGGLTPATSAAF